MNKKQKVVVALLAIAILLSLFSIGLSMSISSPNEFKFISEGSDLPISNVGVTIDSPTSYMAPEGGLNGN